MLEKAEHGDDGSQLVTFYARDHAGRLVRKTLPDGNTVDYTYDRQGNLLSVDDSHWYLSYEYDTQNRLTAEHQGWGTLLYGYDACSQLKNLRLPDNIRLVFNHAKGGHRSTVELNGAVLTSDLFKNGQEHQRQQGQLLSHYHYDEQQRLHAHTVTQQQHYLYQRHYDYDPSGNLTRLNDTRKDEHHYHYDPFGRRISKTVDGITTEFFWQGDKLIAEHHKDRHRSYLYEPDSFRPLALLEGFGPRETKPYHYQLDHLGTPQELTASDGEIVWSAHHRAYGEISRLDIGKIDNPLRFQGQYFDQESGLHYNRHRYYNPDVGRYLTPDPVKLAGGINTYQYVPNPTGWLDPLGFSPCPGGDGCRPEESPNDPAKSVKADDGEAALPKTGGAQRASKYSANWKTADLNENVVKFAGYNPIVTTTDKGKKIHKNPINGVEIVEDLNGGYFRIYDPSLPGSRRYLSLEGVVPNNKISPSGKQIGRTQSEYNEATHFNKEPKK